MPKDPLKVLTLAEKPSPVMFTIPLTAGGELTRVAVPLTVVIEIGSACADAKGKNPMTTATNNWMNLDVEDIGETCITDTSLLAGYRLIDVERDFETADML